MIKIICSDEDFVYKWIKSQFGEKDKTSNPFQFSKFEVIRK